MKYIKFFEAFESNTISKVFKFVKSKIGKSNSFKSSLFRILKHYDIPIDKIKDSNVDYLNRVKALNIKNDSDVSNEFEIYCLKFWFSIEEGYIGYTGVGNNRVNYKNWKNRRSSRKNEPFDHTSLNYIKNKLDITTGEISLVKKEEYSELKTGDKVIGIFQDSDSNLDKLGLATIWVGDYGSIFAIQDVSPGGEPEDDRKETENGEFIYWRDFGRFSWNLGDEDHPGSDHRNLHRYVKSDDPLHYKEGEEIKVDDETESVLDFNLPLAGSGMISNWEYGSSISNEDQIDKADFCVVFYLDNMLDPDKSEFYEKPSDIQNQRIETKKGATKLLSDDEIKEVNVKKYMTELISKMGIKKDISELKDLQKIVLKLLCGNFALIALYSNKPRINRLKSFSDSVLKLIKASEDSDNDKEYYLDVIRTTFKEMNSDAQRFTKFYKISKNYISKENFNTDIFNKIYEIGDYISTYFRGIQIETIEDLRMVDYKLTSILGVFNDYNFRLPDRILSILDNFYDPNDVEYYCERTSLNDEQLKETMKRLNHIERYVKSILK
jgi:hypothetical protein